MTAPKLLATLAIACLLAAAARAEEKVDYAKLIVGKWEITKADPCTAPEGAMVEFTKDGKFKVAAKDINIEGTYKLDGNKFTFTMKDGTEEKTQTITITKITDKEMSTKDKDDKVVELKRAK
jgi:uncharacterized protein (TIGR03066 family)